MVNTLSSPTASHADLLAEFSDFVRAQTGLHFPPPSWHDLEHRMGSAAAEVGSPDAQACMKWLLTSPISAQHVELLARHLTIGETYFFREKPALVALEKIMLPEIIKARRNTTRRLRLWSAGCCTGEEPYTLAIILNRLLPDLKEWDVKILGTDINPHFLALAEAGLYRSWSFRATDPSIKERYFTQTDDRYAIAPEIKQMVTFARLNLADASYSATSPDTENVDVIFCRNTLMYFSPEGVARAISNFHKSLTYGGWLVVNPSEATPANFAQYELVMQPDAILFRKGHSTPEPKETPKGVDYAIAHKKVPEPAPRRITDFEPWEQRDASLRRQPAASDTPKAQNPGSLMRPKKEEPGELEQARTLQKQGRTAEAREKLLALVEQNGDADAQPFGLLASIEANLGRLTAALEWSKRATGADSMSPTNWFLRATILQELGVLDEAVVALKRVLYLDPGFVLAHFVLGSITLQQGRKPEAHRHFNTARSIMSGLNQEDILPGSDGMTTQQMDALIAAMLT